VTKTKKINQTKTKNTTFEFKPIQLASNQYIFSKW